MQLLSTWSMPYLVSVFVFTGCAAAYIKVRDHLKHYDEDPGWYQHPPGNGGA